jgi:hypothetical protein
MIDKAEVLRAEGRSWSHVYSELNIPNSQQTALRDALRQRRARAKKARQGKSTNVDAISSSSVTK